MTLTFRGCDYEQQAPVAEKPSVQLTYRRSHYQAHQRQTSFSQDLRVPAGGFIRSKKTAELIGLSLEPLSIHHLNYRGIEYVR